VYGAEQVLLGLCFELRALGHAPLIVSIGDTRCGEKPLERAARERGLEVCALRMIPGPNPKGAFRLFRLARDEAADVIHTHGYKGDILLGFLPRHCRTLPIVATVHGYTNVNLLSRMALYSWLDRLALRCVDRVVLVHHGMTRRLWFNRRLDGRWRVIENGVGVSNRRAPIGTLDPEVVRFCADRPLVIGAAGRLSKEKGFDILLQAVAEVLPQHDGVAGLVILGEGTERPALERLSKSLGLAGGVLMPGYKSDAKDYFRLFRVFVLSSRTEGLPITLLEAMQAGVPVVATRVGGVPHVLDGGRGGVLVESGDQRALAEGILRCLNDRAFALRLAAHSRTQMGARFNSKAMAARYLDVYRELTVDKGGLSDVIQRS
jgi:glycosyltransferase involved in cell wall biosynthesis